MDAKLAARGAEFALPTGLMSDPAVPALDLDQPAAHAPDGDFAGAMQQLAAEAQHNGRPVPGGNAPVSKAARAEFLLAIGQMIRPLAVGVEGLGERLGKIAAAQAAAKSPDFAPVQTALEGVKGQMARMGTVESANQKLFDALHTELKGYKDGFLFDALQKPFVKDLISLHDDLGTLFGQIGARHAAVAAVVADADEALFLTTLTQNFDNVRHGLLETLERLDVERQDTAPGEPVDKRIHRVLSFEPAPDVTSDGRVARSLRSGFAWRGRPVRPEEIVAWRWTEPSAPAEATAAASH